ncbi:MAG TPA: GNAT family N-acetyltransferase [Mycobacteriales bacterium]|nr:GNAT family N-acetyltransferase [Mycobacteriales bacterium]
MSRSAAWRELAGAELAARADELDDLLAATGAPATARWAAIEVWLRHNSGEQAWGLVHETPDGIDAAAVFARRRRWGLWRVRTVGRPGEQSWIAAADADRARQLAGALTDALGRAGRPWTLLAADLPEPDLAADALARGLPETEVREGNTVPVVRFRPGSRLTDHLSRNTRSAVAKARNRVAADGLRMELTWHREPDVIAGLLPEVIELHQARNRQLRGHAILDDPAERAEFSDTVLAHAGRGDADLLTLRLDGGLAAFAVGLRSGGELYVYANYVSPRWLAHSGGTIANAEVIRYAFEQPGLTGVDWGPGPQRYKLSRAEVRRTQHVEAWSSPTVRRIVQAARAARAGVRRA